MNRVIKFEYGFESVNGIVKKSYHLHEIPNIASKCDVWNVLPVCYVRQFTGLHDKNGKEIYQHDFVKVANNVIYEVIFVDADSDNELFSQFAIRCASRDLTIGFDAYCIDKMEVIGNRFENPSLCE